MPCLHMHILTKHRVNVPLLLSCTALHLPCELRTFEKRGVLKRKEVRLLRIIPGVAMTILGFLQEVGNELFPEIVAVTSCIKEKVRSQALPIAMKRF